MPTPQTPELDKEAFDIYESVLRSLKRGAIEMGVPLGTFRHRVERHKKRLACDSPAPDGFKIKGTSTLFNNRGEVVAQWVKTTADAERQLQIIKEVIEKLCHGIEPLPQIVSNPTCNNDLLVLYPITDFHLGMFAHKQEGGSDWDLDIAKSFLRKWIDKAVEKAEPASQAVLLNLGDFLHQDSLEPVTPASRHVLDSSARFQHIAGVAVDLMIYAVTRMLEKHERVHVIMSDANHDPTSAVWLRIIFKKLYADNPRVTVDETEFPYYCYEWGKTSLFAHHGDKRNMENVTKVFAALYREIFGRTEFSFGHMGHFHHAKSKDDGLMHMRVHPTLAARDAYASRYGYISQRSSTVIFYSKRFGYAGEFAITPEMLI